MRIDMFLSVWFAYCVITLVLILRFVLQSTVPIRSLVVSVYPTLYPTGLCPWGKRKPHICILVVLYSHACFSFISPYKESALSAATKFYCLHLVSL